jgi:hypothetical protein
LGFAFPDGHGETTTNYVAQYVVGDEIEVFVGSIFFEEVDGGDDAASGATNTGLRTTGFYATDITITG